MKLRGAWRDCANLPRVVVGVRSGGTGGAFRVPLERAAQFTGAGRCSTGRVDCRPREVCVRPGIILAIDLILIVVPRAIGITTEALRDQGWRRARKRDRCQTGNECAYNKP